MLQYKEFSSSTTLRTSSDGRGLGLVHTLPKSTFFLKQRQKLCLDLLIKKKRVAQLINGKPDENQYNNNTDGLLPKQATTQPSS
jgi:hypothetical protein